MRAAYLVQVAGTTVVASTFIAAEIMGRLLGAYPSSETLWYINLEIFRPLVLLRRSDMAAPAFLTSNSIAFGAFVILTAWIACALEKRVVVGFLANVSTIVVGVLVYLFATQPKPSDFVSLHWAAPSASGPDYMLLIFLLTASMIACLTCHVAYIRDIFACPKQPLEQAQL